MKLIQSGGKWDSLLVTLMPETSIREAGVETRGERVQARPPSRKRQLSDSDDDRRTKMTSLLHVMNVAHDVAAKSDVAWPIRSREGVAAGGFGFAPFAGCKIALPTWPSGHVSGM